MYRSLSPHVWHSIIVHVYQLLCVIDKRKDRIFYSVNWNRIEFLSAPVISWIDSNSFTNSIRWKRKNIAWMYEVFEFQISKSNCCIAFHTQCLWCGIKYPKIVINKKKEKKNQQFCAVSSLFHCSHWVE